MQVVIEHYGKFMLDVIVLLLVVTLVFFKIEDESGNKGMLAIIGARINVESVDYSIYTDFKETYKKESEKTPPNITCMDDGITVGTYKLSNYIKAIDYAGQNLALKIISIKAPDGIDVMDTYNQDTSEIFLSQAGVYTVLVAAVDDGNRMTKTSFKILVNNE